MKRTRRATKYGRKKTMRKRSTKRTLRNTFTRRVARVLDRKAEKKVVIHNSNVTAFNQAISSSGDCLRIMPTIALGTSQSARTGNKITIKSLKLQGVITAQLTLSGTSQQRIGVRLMIVKARDANSWQLGAANFTSDYTKLIEGQITGFSGLVTDWNGWINRDFFTPLVDKRYRITVGGVAAGQNYQTWNSYKCINFDFKKLRNKILQYEPDEDADDPINFPYFMLLGYAYLDGGLPDSLQTYVTMQYNTKVEYVDY